MLDYRVLPPRIDASTSTVDLRVLNSEVLHYATTNVRLTRLDPALAAFVSMPGFVALERVTGHRLVGDSLVKHVCRNRGRHGLDLKLIHICRIRMLHCGGIGIESYTAVLGRLSEI